MQALRYTSGLLAAFGRHAALRAFFATLLAFLASYLVFRLRLNMPCFVFLLLI
jgi:hypothetical protein